MSSSNSISNRPKINPKKPTILIFTKTNSDHSIFSIERNSSYHLEQYIGIEPMSPGWKPGIITSIRILQSGCRSTNDPRMHGWTVSFPEVQYPMDGLYNW